MLSTRIYKLEVDGLSKGDIITLHMKISQLFEHSGIFILNNVLDYLQRYKRKHNLSNMELMDLLITYRTKYSDIIREYSTDLSAMVMQLSND